MLALRRSLLRCRIGIAQIIQAMLMKSNKRESAPALFQPPSLMMLSARHRLFVMEYSIDMNATRAYLTAYPGTTHTAARVSASKLLAKTNVKTAIDAVNKHTLDALGITKLRIVGEIAKLAFFDPADAVNADGSMKPINQWPPGLRAAVQSIDASGPSGLAAVTSAGKPKKVRFINKMVPLEILLKLSGMLQEPATVETQDPLMQLINELKDQALKPVEHDPDLDELWTEADVKESVSAESAETLHATRATPIRPSWKNPPKQR